MTIYNITTTRGEFNVEADDIAYTPDDRVIHLTREGSDKPVGVLPLTDLISIIELDAKQKAPF